MGVLVSWLVVLLAGCGARSGLDHDERATRVDGGGDVDSGVVTRPDAGLGVDSGVIAPGMGVLAIELVPTARVQLAVWVEGEGAERMDTIALTEAVAYRGIGNRPGASQMNSGYRWPYGRREGVLPYWAHRRVALGGRPFPRVVYQDRPSEGFASRTTVDQSVDDYFCLSFDAETTRRHALDAVSCASVFNSDKGSSGLRKRRRRCTSRRDGRLGA
jgi:hypothetical protein